jgi:cytochrome c553
MDGRSRNWHKLVLLFCTLVTVWVLGCDAEDAADDGASKGATVAKKDTAGSIAAANTTDENLENESGTEKKRVLEPDVNDARFHEAIKAAADEYLKFGLVNTRVNQVAAPRVASQLCKAPMVDVEPEPRMSGAAEDASHGQKLYFLFAKDIAHYTNRDGSKSPVGQTLVKESWTSRPGNPNARNLRTHASALRVNPRVQVGEKMLEIGLRTDLFVMVKQPVDTAGTDEGWVYGVIDAESREIKSAGAVASCIVCHDGQTDRLFRDEIPDWNAEAKKLSTDRPKPDDESESE